MARKLLFAAIVTMTSRIEAQVRSFLFFKYCQTASSYTLVTCLGHVIHGDLSPFGMPQAALSAALLVSAYILQQRFCPFLVSSTLSSSLELGAAELEAKLQQQRERAAASMGSSKVRTPSISHARRRSRGASLSIHSLAAATAVTGTATRDHPDGALMVRGRGC